MAKKTTKPKTKKAPAFGAGGLKRARERGWLDAPGGPPDQQRRDRIRDKLRELDAREVTGVLTAAQRVLRARLKDQQDQDARRDDALRARERGEQQ